MADVIRAFQTSILVLSIASASEAAGQTLPPSCTNLSTCYNARLNSTKATGQCCGQYPGTVFHCQEFNSSRTLSACLPTEKCSPGHVPHLVETEEGIRLSCKVCDDRHFESQPRESYTYNVPICVGLKQSCPAENGKALVSLGDAAHDNRCRCLWEEGWAPISASGAKCDAHEGFVKYDPCHCEKRQCPEGKQLNEDYMCEATTTPRTTKMEVPTTTPSPQREMTTPSPQREMTTPSPQRKMTTPSPQRKMTTPSAQTKMTTPSPQRKMTTPSPQTKMTTPSAQTKMTTPPPQSEMTTPSPQKKMTTPSPQRKMTTPSPQSEMTTSSPQRKMTTPSPQSEMTTPSPQRKMTTPPPQSEMTTPPLQSEMTTPSPQSEMTTPPPQRETTTPPPQRKPHWIPEDKPFPGGLKEKDDAWRKVYLYVSVVVVVGLIIFLHWFLYKIFKKNPAHKDGFKRLATSDKQRSERKESMKMTTMKSGVKQDHTPCTANWNGY